MNSKKACRNKNRQAFCYLSFKDEIIGLSLFAAFIKKSAIATELTRLNISAMADTTGLM